MDCRNPKCGKEIEDPSPENRYCPYCGRAYVLPCENVGCAVADDPHRTQPAQIIVGRDASCYQCGAIYHYTQTGLPQYVSVRGPFVAPSQEGNETSAPLVDLLPASGAALPTQAHLATKPSLLPFPDAVEARSLFGKAAMSAAELRHGNLYTVAQNGEVVVFDAFTLQKRAYWPRPLSLPGWSTGLAQETTIRVSETILGVLHQKELHGFDAGSGARLFRLPLDELSQPQFLLLQDRLLVMGVTNAKREEAWLYRLEHLMDRTVDVKRPERTYLLSEQETSDVALPSFRLTALGDTFYLLSRNGTLYAITGFGPLEAVYENFGNRSLHAWNVSEGGGAIILAPVGQQRYYEMVSFSLTAPYKIEGPTQMATIQPRKEVRTLPLYGGDAFILDEVGSLHRLPMSSPYQSTASWEILRGVNPREVFTLGMAPWGGRHHLLLHYRDDFVHHFRRIEVSAPDNTSPIPIGTRPEVGSRVRIGFSGNRFYILNLSEGHVTPHLLP